MKAYILAAGNGSRIWPFGELRNKAALPISNIPLITRTIAACREAGIGQIIIGTGYLPGSVANLVIGETGVSCIAVGATAGPAATLSALLRACPPEGDFLVINGDTIIEGDDISRLISRHTAAGCEATVLTSAEYNGDDSGDWITVSASLTDKEGFVSGLSGHPKGSKNYRICAAYAFSPGFIRYIDGNAGMFTNLSVGGMSPVESYIEASLADYIERGNTVAAIEATGLFIDIDKPWHIMEACYIVSRRDTMKLTDNELAKGASIDPLAVVNGRVRLGKNSRIGRNCLVNGNIIVGDNTIIDNGAIIDGNSVIGNNTTIENYCYINNAVIGNRCKVLHAAEFSGVLFDHTFLYHYMEIDGLLGQNVDIGACCVCGTLRFDEGRSSTVIKGRRETPRNFSNATYIGDFTRTGVNCTFFPGVRIGTHCAVGPGMLVSEDIESRTCVLAKQESIKKPWGPEKYGW